MYFFRIFVPIKYIFKNNEKIINLLQKKHMRNHCKFISIEFSEQYTFIVVKYKSAVFAQILMQNRH